MSCKFSCQKRSRGTWNFIPRPLNSSWNWRIKYFKIDLSKPFALMLKLLLLPHSLFPCVHGMLRCRSREEERMMYSCLEKGLGPSLLVERLIEHSCSVKNGPRYFLRKVWEARKQPRPVPAECRRRQKYNYQKNSGPPLPPHGWGGGPDLSAN